jgi:hypothetical protein
MLKSHDHEPKTMVEVQMVSNQLAVYTNYFSLKDALVKQMLNSCCKKLLKLVALEAVQMDKLPMDVHMVWMKVMKSLIADTKEIASNADVKKAKNIF